MVVLPHSILDYRLHPFWLEVLHKIMEYEVHGSPTAVTTPT